MEGKKIVVKGNLDLECNPNQLKEFIAALNRRATDKTLYGRIRELGVVLDRVLQVVVAFISVCIDTCYKSVAYWRWQREWDKLCFVAYSKRFVGGGFKLYRVHTSHTVSYVNDGIITHSGCRRCGVMWSVKYYGVYADCPVCECRTTLKEQFMDKSLGGGVEW